MTVTSSILLVRSLPGWADPSFPPAFVTGAGGNTPQLTISWRA